MKLINNYITFPDRRPSAFKDNSKNISLWLSRKNQFILYFINSIQC